MKSQFTGALLLASVISPLQESLAQEPAQLPAGMEPVKMIQLEEPGAVLSYRHRSGATVVELVGTRRVPEARGELKVESKAGFLEIDVNRNGFRGLPPAWRLGKDFLTYVFWAVSIDGKAENLGEVLFETPPSEQTTGINVSTPFQTFWLMVTAEPDFAVAEPSPFVVMVSSGQEKTVTENKALPVRGGLIYYTHYDRYDTGRATSAPAASAPNEVLQARKAVELAQGSGILKHPTPAGQEPLPDEVRNRETLETAGEFLKRAETTWVAAGSDAARRRESVQFARTAAQIAENARALAVGAVGQIFVRQLSRELDAVRAQLASSQQENQQLRGSLEETKRQFEQLRADSSSRIASLDRTIADLNGKISDLNSRILDLQDQAARRQTESETLRRELEIAQSEVVRLRGERDRICTELRAQLRSLGNLTEEGGRIVLTLASDILFDFDKFDLRPAAREQLAKLAVLQLLLFRDVPVVYEGHTDLVGAEEYNMWLSQQRALSVAAYLLDQRLQLYKDDPQKEQTTAKLDAVGQLLKMDFPRSQRESSLRSDLLGRLEGTALGKGPHEPVEQVQSKSERNRRVEIEFIGTADRPVSSLCEEKAPAQ